MQSRTRRKCPRCGSPSTKGHGPGRWVCLNCGRTFSAKTGTIMSSAKLEGKKLRLVLSTIARDCTIAAVCDCAGVSSRAAYIWRMKVFEAVAKEPDSSVLHGKVWIDETYVPANRNDLVMNGQFKLRGVSRNQISIACAIGCHGSRIAYASGKGHITSSQCRNIYSPHIKDGSTVIHDGIFSHERFIAERGLREETQKPKAKGANEALGPTSHLCAMAQRNMVQHIGEMRKYARLRVSWVAFKPSMKGMSRAEKADYLAGICCASGIVFRVKDRYRLKQ